MMKSFVQRALSVGVAIAIICCTGCSNGNRLSSAKSKGVVVKYEQSDYSTEKAERLAELLGKFIKEDKSEPVYLTLSRHERSHMLTFPLKPEIAVGPVQRRNYRAMGRYCAQELFDNQPFIVSVCRPEKGSLREIEKIVAVSEESAPISISFRQAISGSEYVLVVKNTSTSKLVMTCHVVRDGNESTFDIDLPASRSTEHGWLEGFSFKKGDKVDLENLDLEYGSVRAVCPQPSL
jgi:hypothetical protein